VTLPNSDPMPFAPQDGLEIGYRGVESGQVEAVIKAASPDAAPLRAFVSGLEASAPGGESQSAHKVQGALHVAMNAPLLHALPVALAPAYSLTQR